MRLVLTATAFALLLAPSFSLQGQQFFTPGAEVNGQINVQVNATLDDGLGEYHPVPGLVLTLYRGATDSLLLKTDDAGVLRFAAAPGTYRLSTPEPVRWHGRSYRWNVALDVKPRMGIVNLTVANAVVSGSTVAQGPSRAARDRATSESANASAIASENARPSVVYAAKDGGTAVLFGFLLTGAGQFYAGNNTKGAVLLGLSLAEVATAVGVLGNCDPYCSDSDITTAEVLLLPAVFNWVYGMATAPGDVRKWNEAHGAVARVRPMIERERGRTGVGFAISY
jgi:hypothetical protein